MDDLISRQAAIDAMAELQGIASTKAELKGISKAWKRIKKLPSAQPELIAQGAYVRGFEQGRAQGMLDVKLKPTCNQLATDCISRQAAIEAINHICPVDTEYDCTLLDRVDVRCVLSDLPSAQPERIRGRWIEKPHVHGVAYCSLCDYELHTNDTNFCPNCGADMRGEQDE